MRTVASSELPGDWRKLAEEAQREPLHISGDGGPDVVVLSRAQYERMRGAARERLKASLVRMHEEVARSNLTPEELETLLADAD